MRKCYVGLEMPVNPRIVKLVAGHREPGDRIVVDFIATHFAGEAPDANAQWVVDQLREANITSEVDVVIDQWDTATLAAALRARGLDVRTMHSSAVVAVIHNLGKMINDEMVVAPRWNTPAMFGVEYAFGLMVLAAQSDSPEEPVVPPTPATLGDVWALYQRLSADDQALFQVLAKAYVRHTDGGVSLVGLTDNDFSELLAGRLKP